MNKENPLVSIIVRTKDRPKLLKSALQSIADQTYRPIEVVLVNDGGCDLEVEELKGILGDIFLNYIRLEENKGRSYAGNIGIENAQGEYIGFLDDDDEFYPEHVETLITFLKQSDYKVAYTDSFMVYKEYNPQTHRLSNDVKREIAFSLDFNYDRLVFENYIPFMCLLFERKPLVTSGGFDNSFDLYEDWDLLIRIGNKYSFYHIKQITANYNQWSIDFQISQRNKDPNFLRQAYLKILSRHIDKITPSRIHDYMSEYVHTRHLLKDLKNKCEMYGSLSRDRDSRVNTLNAELKDKDSRGDALNAELKDRDSQLVKLYAELKEKELQVKKLYNELKNRDSHVGALNAELRDRDSQIDILNVGLKGKDAQAVNLQTVVRDRDDLITAMRNTLGWRILERYRRIRNRIFLHWFGTRSQDNLIIKGLIVLKNEGFKSLVRKANKKFLFNKAVRKPLNLYKPIDITKISLNVIDEPIQSKVSIIIPTKNAGEEFDYTLRRINQQEGIGEIELIIIDSGSQDRTVDISKSYTKNVFQISPKDFHHAKTRNLGAERATGDFLLFMVQDAIPVGNQWLYKLFTPIQQGIVSAVTTKQLPRSDADLFASWGYWAHYKYLGYDRDHIRDSSIFKNFDELDIKAKRAIASLDSVCLGIKKTIFDVYRFKTNYAEDLELGIRLIKGGHALMFQSSNAVIHSHNRPAMYFFKRSYVDTVTLSEILQINRKSIPAESILETISYLYCTLKICLSKINMENESWKEPDLLIHSLINSLDNRMNDFDPAWRLLKGDSLLDKYFEKIPPRNHKDISSGMHSILSGSLLNFSEFLKCYSAVDIKEDVQNSLYKFFANMAGHYLGVNTCDKNNSMYEGI